jgi:hypothetical protein
MAEGVEKVANHHHEHAAHDHTHHERRFEAYGVPIVVSATSMEVLAHIDAIMPPGWNSREPSEDEHRFALTTTDGVRYRVQGDDGSVPGSSDLDVALDILDAQIRACIAVNAPERVFVHAGAVAYRDRAIVIPGVSFAGKSSLVAELVRAGAVYYSDEYAVLDETGLVHPYAKPLSLRTGSLRTRLTGVADHHVSTLGGVAGDKPVPIGVVISTVYDPDARWEPRRLSTAQGVMAMLANTVVAQERPEQTMTALTRAVEGAVVLEGDRGEAKDIVGQIFAIVDEVGATA